MKKDGLSWPRMWIYLVMLVGGMIWGVHLIVTTLRDAQLP